MSTKNKKEPTGIDKKTLPKTYKILDNRLPKTSDNVIILPRMRVYWHYRNELTSAIINSISNTEWFAVGGGQPYYIKNKSIPYFSTLNLALIWQAEKLEKQAKEARNKCTF